MYRVVDESGNHFVISDYSKVKQYKECHEFCHKLYSLREAILLLENYGFIADKIIGSAFLRRSTLGYYFHRITNYSLWLDQTINRMTNYLLAENIVLSYAKSDKND